MFALILIVGIVLSIVSYKSKKCILLCLFFSISIVMALGIIGFSVGYMRDNCTKSDLQNDRKKLQEVQEDKTQLMKQLVKTEDEKTFCELFESYEKLENQCKSLEVIVDERSYWLERGGKERIKFYLNLNLF